MKKIKVIFVGAEWGYTIGIKEGLGDGKVLTREMNRLRRLGFSPWLMHGYFQPIAPKKKEKKN